MDMTPAGAYVEVDRVLDVAGGRIEVLRTLADCTGTRIYYRAGRGIHVAPRAVWPPEIEGGMSAHGGDEIEAEFKPVLPHRKEIKVVFGWIDEDSSEPVTIPIDRERTSRLDRQLIEPRPGFVHTDGLDIEVIDARVGALGGRIDLLIRGRDESIYACDFGWPHGIHRGGPPDDRPLWIDWRPDAGEHQATKTVVGDHVTVSMSSIISVTARKRPVGSLRPSRQPRPRPPRPPDPVTIEHLPDHTEIRDVTATRRSETRRPVHELHAEVDFSPPSTSSDAIELIISGLYVFRAAEDEIKTIPLPAPGEDLALNDIEFATRDGSVRLLRWEAGHNEIPTLVVRPPSPLWYPDIRVLHGNASVSLWMRPGNDGTIAGGLPTMYREAFEGSSVRLGLRLLGKPAPAVRMALPLSPMGS
ncbi:MAG: hypothetical protein ACRDKG_00380 [Actinomycetota bacterium]